MYGGLNRSEFIQGSITGILEGKMSYLKIGKRQHLNIKNFGKKNYEMFLNVY